MTAKEILQQLHAMGKGWVDPESTVDRITHGPADREVMKAAVTWMGTTRAIRKAAEQECQLVIVHEPIIWQRKDRDKESFDRTRSDAKRELLDELGITAIRCHDLWDRYPKLGVCEWWPKSLGLTDYTVERYEAGTIFALCRMAAGTTLGEIGILIAEKTADLGQQYVAVVGSTDMPVQSLATNVGAWGSNPECLVEARDRYGADAFVATEFCWWEMAGYALDTGMGLVHVNHGVSECASIESLYNHLDRSFLDIEFTYIHEAAPYTMVGPGGA